MSQKKHSFLTLLGMIYVSIMIGAAMLSRKIVNLGFVETTAAALIFPLWFFLSDIIAEVYGYSVTRKFFWCACITALFFSVIVYMGSALPVQSGWAHRESYDFIVKYIPRALASYFLSLIIAGFLNTYLLVKWKILTRGKLFWLRSFVASSIGQIIFSVLATTLLFVGIIPIKEIAALTWWSSFFKLIYLFMLAFPATLLASFLKIKENCDVYDTKTNFNPFIFSEKSEGET